METSLFCLEELCINTNELNLPKSRSHGTAVAVSDGEAHNYNISIGIFIHRPLNEMKGVILCD